MGTAINQLMTQIHGAYAHNSYLYDFLDTKASPRQIVDFLLWDAAQPPFHAYLSLWVPKAHPLVLPALQKHIVEEVNERHSDLFREMLNVLEEAFPGKSPQVEQAILNDLNYPFSAECSAKESFAYFCGSFLATEVMSAKRCKQLLEGLTRHGISASKLEYLRLHAISDQNHALEVQKCFVQPILSVASFAEVERGVSDRLERSAKYLRWYEAKFLR